MGLGFETCTDVKFIPVHVLTVYKPLATGQLRSSLKNNLKITPVCADDPTVPCRRLTDWLVEPGLTSQRGGGSSKYCSNRAPSPPFPVKIRDGKPWLRADRPSSRAFTNDVYSTNTLEEKILANSFSGSLTMLKLFCKVS